MKKKYIVFVYTILIASVYSQTPALKWVYSVGHPESQQLRAAVLDHNADLISAGWFDGTVDFNAGPGTTTLNAFVGTLYDNFVMKTDSSGNFLWAKALFSTNQMEIRGVAVDASNNIYMMGDFRGLLDADPGPATYTMFGASVSQDVFIIKWSPTGNFLWSKQIGSSGLDTGYSIEIDNAGNILISGLFQQTVDFDPGAGTFMMSSASSSDFYLLKLNSFGNFIWARQLSSSMALEAHFKLLTNGDILLAGNYSGLCDIDPGPGTTTISSPGTFVTEGFVCKLSSQGNFIWARTLESSTGNSWCNQVVTDTAGNIYCTGALGSAVTDFDPGPGSFTVSAPNTQQPFLWKLDSNGNFVWTHVFSTSLAFLNSTTFDAAQNIYLNLQFQGNIDVDPGPGQVIYSGQTVNSVILEIDNQGLYVWSHMFGPNYIETQSNINNSQELYLTGSFAGTIDFDPSTTVYTLSAVQSTLQPSAPATDIVLFKLRLSCQPLPPTDITPSTMKSICSGNSTTLSVSPGGQINWYSAPSSTTILSSNSSLALNNVSAGTYTYYADATTCISSQPRTSVVFTVSACTSIENVKNDLKEVNVRPVPASERIEIINLSHNVDRIELYDTRGALIFSGAQTYVDASGLDAGVYYLKIYSKTQFDITKKIVVAR